jgi:hypothetical protein
VTFRLPAAPPDQGPSALDGTLELSPTTLLAGVDHCEPDPRGCSADLALSVVISRSVPISIQ